MCIKEETVKKVVGEAVNEINVKRDKNLDNKLKGLKKEIFEEIDNKLKPLTTLPNKCTERGENIIRMTEQIKALSEEQRKTNDKIDKFIDAHAKILEKMDEKFVSNDAFTPVKNIVYGLVGAILMAVVGAVMAVILTNT